MSLREQFLLRMQTGLRRTSITKPSEWAEKYRVMGHPFPGKWDWKHHPWLREMHDSKAQANVGQKGAQLGFTELVLNVTGYTVDVLRMDCLYLLPNTRPDATDFSVGRFNRAVELSPHMTALFSETNNVGHKKAGSVNVYIRGMNSRSALKGLPVTGLVFDELDEMDPENITLAEARSDGQLVKWDWKISTPRLPGVGINKYYLDSTQEHFMFPCPSCSRTIELKFPESFVVTGDDLHDPNLKNSHLICYECKAVLPHETKSEYLAKGFWIANFPQSDIRGFHVSQLYSPAIPPFKLAQKWVKAQKSAVDEQEFYNSNIGNPHIVADAQVSEADIEKCIKEHTTTDHAPPGSLVTMGVDVGRVCHYEIAEWFTDGIYQGDEINMNAIPKVIAFGTCDFPELVKLMRNFQVKAAVIDALPETRKSTEFANKFPGYVKMCYYNHHVKAKRLSGDPKGNTISVNRTSWLDLSLTRFRTNTILLPKNIDKEYKAHIVAPVKVPEHDVNGEATARFLTPPGVADHYAHARNYNEIALPLALGYGPTTNTDKV